MGIQLPAVKRYLQRFQQQFQLKSARMFQLASAGTLSRTSPPRSARLWTLRSADQSPDKLIPQLKRKSVVQQHVRSVLMYQRLSPYHPRRRQANQSAPKARMLNASL